MADKKTATFYARNGIRFRGAVDATFPKRWEWPRKGGAPWVFEKIGPTEYREIDHGAKKLA